MAEKFPTKTKQATAKNALAASFLALRVLKQVKEKLENEMSTSASWAGIEKTSNFKICERNPYRGFVPYAYNVSCLWLTGLQNDAELWIPNA